MAKPFGQRGSWFANWNGENLPCVHKHWTKGIWPHHNDPGVTDDVKWIPFIESIKNGERVILTDDHVTDDGQLSGSRKGYIALWRVANVERRGNELHFDFVEKLKDFR